jgi:hypothetical protein
MVWVENSRDVISHRVASETQIKLYNRWNVTMVFRCWLEDHLPNLLDRPNKHDQRGQSFLLCVYNLATPTFSGPVEIGRAVMGDNHNS